MSYNVQKPCEKMCTYSFYNVLLLLVTLQTKLHKLCIDMVHIQNLFHSGPTIMQNLVLTAIRKNVMEHGMGSHTFKTATLLYSYYFLLSIKDTF